MNKLKVLPDPKKAGLHEYHDNRWVASEDVEIGFAGFEPDQIWYTTKGFLVAEMRDVDPKYAKLFAAAPELLSALKCALADLTGIMPEFEPSGERTHPAWETISEARSAIAKATL